MKTSNLLIKLLVLVCFLALIVEAFPKKGESKAEKAARKAAKAAKKAAKKAKKNKNSNNNNNTPAPAQADPVLRIAPEDCDENKLKDFKVQCYVDQKLYDIMDKDFRNPSAANKAILDNVKMDSLSCMNAQAVKSMSNSAKQALEVGKYSFTMEFNIETTGDSACDKKLGLGKGGKKNKGK